MIDRRLALMGGLGVAALAASEALRPRRHLVLLKKGTIEEAVPTTFGNWTAHAASDLVSPEQAGRLANSLYRELVSRAYLDEETGTKGIAPLAPRDSPSGRRPKGVVRGAWAVRACVTPGNSRGAPSCVDWHRSVAADGIGSASLTLVRLGATGRRGSSYACTWRSPSLASGTAKMFANASPRSRGRPTSTMRSSSARTAGLPPLPR